jgi:hypothetical protein
VRFTRIKDGTADAFGVGKSADAGPLPRCTL